MKRLWAMIGFSALAVIAILVWMQPEEMKSFKSQPNDWFFSQRAFPYGEINEKVYFDGLQRTKAMKAERNRKLDTWELAGPSNIGGRITDVELSPTNTDTIYAGAASGGLWRSADAGQSWTAIFDEPLSQSIGDLVLDPSDSKTIYVGTGEANGGGGSQTYLGYGVYKSTDSGDTWEHLGLEETCYIGRVAVDPQDSQRIFVAAMGKLYNTSSQRGLYRTTDGGNNWEQVLFLSDSTGCIDVVIHPDNPDTLYAAMWERIRYPNGRAYGGVTSGLYRSYDGGDTWQELTDNLPNNAPDVGRIGISISQSNPNILYTIYADVPGFFDGIYKTTDNGDTWTRTNDGSLSNIYSSFGWWFGNIRVDPANPDIAYAMGLEIYKTTNGGDSWFYSSGGIHVDQHGLYIHPTNSDYVVAGNDGGIYVSENGGSSYTKSPNLPITQFYTSEIDYQFPERLYGGTQDNGTNRTLTGGLNDWQFIWGGDGFYVLVDPTDNNFVYAESQWGNLVRSTNGGNSFVSALNGVDFSDRSNWNSPLVMDPNNPAVLYFGTDKVYRTENRATSWTAISEDLSNGPGNGNLPFGTVTTIAVARTNDQVIYAGTDDSNVWVTLNGGSDWTQISADLPERWVTRLAVDPHDEMTAYVTLSGYRYDEYLPHIFRTNNAGASWEDISGNLPELPLNDVIIDTVNANLYVASDAGVFYTADAGINWQLLGADFPLVPVTDLTLHQPTRKLVAATYGRSMYSYNLDDATGIDDRARTPVDFRLFQNYPNPFNPATTIEYSLASATNVKLTIVNTLGQTVKTLVNERQSAGHRLVRWEGRNDSGNQVASGVYLYILEVEGRIETRKMMLLK